ncbi:MAG: hypothetical protein KF820_08110 [Candidatus Paracaedibacteraceae bacterium]|nr:hypothetical protein [Candidatus Paracaedibacteraceae bacterium]
MSESVVFPILKKQDVSDHKVSLFLEIPRDLYYLDGHFPGVPIVAGVVQLHWAIVFARQYFDLPMGVKDVSKVKFSNLMQPNDAVYLTLNHDTDKHLISYSYDNGDKNYATGCFNY